jgi:hypothetical protein
MPKPLVLLPCCEARAAVATIGTVLFWALLIVGIIAAHHPAVDDQRRGWPKCSACYSSGGCCRGVSNNPSQCRGVRRDTGVVHEFAAVAGVVADT